MTKRGLLATVVCAADKDDSRVADKGDRHARVWLLDVDTRALKQVTSGRWQIRQIQWLPSGKRLVAVATSKPGVGQWTDHLYTISLESGDLTEITAPRGPVGGLALSPDGKTLAHRGRKRDNVESELVLYPREGHGLREEKHLLDRLNRIVASYDRYLKPGQPSTAPQ